MKNSIKTIFLLYSVLQLLFSCQASSEDEDSELDEFELAENAKDASQDVVYRFVNYTTGLALSTGGETESGSEIIFEDISDSDEQYWEIIEQSEIEFEGEIIDFYHINIQNVATGMYLALPNYCYDVSNIVHCDGVVQEESPGNNREVWIPFASYEEYDEYETAAMSFFNRASNLSLSADETGATAYADMDYFLSIEEGLRGYSLFVLETVCLQ